MISFAPSATELARRVIERMGATKLRATLDVEDAPGKGQSIARLALAGQQFVPVLFEQGGRVLGHNIGEAHHTTLFQPTLIWPIRWLMYSSADSLRCSVRWV